MTLDSPLAPRQIGRAITDAEVLAALLETALVGRVGVIADGEPYVVPMNFAYVRVEGSPGEIIIHGADQGRLLSALANQGRVCFEIDSFLATIPYPVLCDFDTAYTSVICYGRARRLTDLEERTHALRLLSRKYAPPKRAEALKPRTVERYRSDMDSSTAVVVIALESISGKQQVVPT